MLRSGMTVIALLAIGACAQIPAGAEVLTGDALAARVSGQAFEVAMPANEIFGEGVLLRAELEANGVANMSATENGERIRFFDDTQRWSVRGQSLCISDEVEPEPSDCIRVDWIQGNRMQITDIRSDGEKDVGVGMLTPL